jgi:hypothetical protein
VRLFLVALLSLVPNCMLYAQESAARSAATNADRQTVANQLIGAWETVVFEADRPLPPNTNPLHPLPALGVIRAGTGIRLFTARYYSFHGLASNAERARLPNGAATVDQLIAAWAPVSGSSGTYVLRGDTLILEAIVSKNPRPAGLRERFTIRFVGDSLFLMANGLTEKCLRVDN